MHESIEWRDSRAFCDIWDLEQILQSTDFQKKKFKKRTGFRDSGFLQLHQLSYLINIVFSFLFEIKIKITVSESISFVLKGIIY